MAGTLTRLAMNTGQTALLGMDTIFLQGRTAVNDIPSDIVKTVLDVGPAEWGATDAFDAEGHAAHVAVSISKTDEHFGQEGPQRMHGLYKIGNDTVICHVGTSPNSPNIARALAAVWNRLHEECHAIALAESAQ